MRSAEISRIERLESVMVEKENAAMLERIDQAAGRLGAFINEHMNREQKECLIAGYPLDGSSMSGHFANIGSVIKKIIPNDGKDVDACISECVEMLEAA